jgi:hypothetical protein
VSRVPREGRGDWVSLVDGVRVSRRWMTRHTPRLLAAWCDATSGEERRAVAARILQAAADLESEPDDTSPPPGARTWREVAERIGVPLAHDPDWLPLAAALARASAAGYDVTGRLPALAAAAPLPDRHPARELHWRLLDDCPAALPSPGAPDRLLLAGDGHAVHTPAGRPPIRTARRPDGPGSAPSAHPTPGGDPP